MRQAKKRGEEVQRHGNKIIERTTDLVTEQAQNVTERAHNAVDNLQNTADRLHADPKFDGFPGATKSSSDDDRNDCVYDNFLDDDYKKAANHPVSSPLSSGSRDGGKVKFSSSVPTSEGGNKRNRGSMMMEFQDRFGDSDMTFALGPRGANDVSIQPCRYFNTIFLWHSFQCFTELQS